MKLTCRKLVVGGIVVLLASTAATFLLLRPSQDEVSDKAAPIVTYSTSTPDQVKPDSNYNWRGTARDPKKITIPSLNINGYMQNVGVDQHKEIAVPNNVHLAGWFVDSVRPGDKGLSIVDGHIDLISGDAIFQHLGGIQKGAEISITFGDDSVRRFRVIRVQDVSLDEAADALFSSMPSVTNQLNLITCSGDYDESIDRFSRRVIVSAELVKGS